jgi:hypothetical protein
MIKINLLPKSIGQSTMSQVTAGFCAFCLVLVVGGLLGYYHTVMVPKTEDMQGQAAKAEALKATVQGIKAEAEAQKSLIAPIQAKVDFVSDVQKYNKRYPELYEHVASWTYDQVVYSSMSTAGGTLTMSARAQSLEDLGRYLLNMYRATDMFKTVSISNVPSYPGRNAVPNNGRGPIIQTPLDFTVTCQLTDKYVFSPPTPPSGATASAPASPMGGGMGTGMGPGAGMGGGAMPGMGGGMPGMKGMGPAPGLGGGGAMPGMGGGMPGMKGMGPAPGLGGGGAMPGMGGGMPGMKGMGPAPGLGGGGAMPGMGMGAGPGAKSN